MSQLHSSKHGEHSRTRSVKFSTTTLEDGSNEGSQEAQDDVVLHVVNRLPSDMTDIPHPNKAHKLSFQTDDPIGLGMSSFLSTRDSLELVKHDSEAELTEQIAKLVTELNAGKLGKLEMRQLTNFAQKLMGAHDAGEVVGKNHAEFDVEVVPDDTVIHVLTGPAGKPSVNDTTQTDLTQSVEDRVNLLTKDIHSKRLTPSQLANLALIIVGSDTDVAAEVGRKITAVKGRTALSDQDSVHIFSSAAPSTSKVKWQAECHNVVLARQVRKLKAKIMMAPGGSSFVEGLDKVLDDIEHNTEGYYFYDAMLLTVCIALTNQAWQAGRMKEDQMCVHGKKAKSECGQIIADLTITMFQKITVGITQEEYCIADLIRMSGLIATCEGVSRRPGHTTLPDKSSTFLEMIAEQEKEVIRGLKHMKALMETNMATITDLKLLADIALKLQDCGQGSHENSIWKLRTTGSRVISDWTFSVSLMDTASPDVLPALPSLLLARVQGLKNSFPDCPLLQVTLPMTEDALKILRKNPTLTDFWAGSLVLIVALVVEQIKSDCYSSNMDYKVLDLLINNLVFEAFNVALKRMQNNDISLSQFQALTTTVTNYRSNLKTSNMFGVLPCTVSKGSAVHHVSSPYSVMDFLEKALQVIKNNPPMTADEVQAVGEYALSLQQFYGQEICEIKQPRLSFSPSNDIMKDTHWSECSATGAEDNMSAPVTAQVILYNLDIAIDKVRQQDTTQEDLLKIACFVTYLIEVPEKLSKGEEPSLPASTCSLDSYEMQLLKVRRITHYIPRFDFIIRNLEKALEDMKGKQTGNYNYDMILLSMCIFIAYEWIRTEPLSVFSVTKLDDRAANVIYEAMQSTLQGIKGGTLVMSDLHNLTSIITKTNDLRRASGVNVSLVREQAKQDDESMPGPPPRTLVNDTMVLEFIDELVLNDGNSTGLNVEKLNKILKAIQGGQVSSYLYELLVLSICVAASKRAVLLSDGNLTAPPAVLGPDKEAQESAIRAIKRTIDGLRSGCIHEEELRMLTEFLANQAQDKISPNQMEVVTNRLTTHGAELARVLMGITNTTDVDTDHPVTGATHAVAVGKILDFFVNLGAMASESGWWT